MRLAAALLTLAFLALAGSESAFAVQPWEYPNQNGANYRRSADAPTRSIGSAPTGPARTPTWKRTFDAPVTGTPIVSRYGGVYVGDHGGLLHGLIYSNGRTVCSQNVGAVGTGTPPSPVTGSALFLDNKSTVYVVANKPGRPRLVAVHPFTCDLKWASAPIDSQVNWEASDPAYSPEHDLIIVGTCVCTAERNRTSGVGGRGAVVAIDPDTGQIVWKTYTVSPVFNGGAVAGTPLIHDALDRVYVGTDHAFVGGVADPNTDAILALDLATGAIVGSYQARQNDIATPSNLDVSKRLGFASSLVAVPTETMGTLIGGGDKGGAFYVVDPLTLELVFKTDVGVGSGVGGVSGLTVDPTEKVIHGVTAAPATFFGVDPELQSLLYTHPGNDVLHYGLPSFASNAVWSTDTAGFIDIEDPTNGRGIGRLFLGAPSTGGIAFSRRMLFASIGISGGTSGGVAAFK